MNCWYYQVVDCVSLGVYCCPNSSDHEDRRSYWDDGKAQDSEDNTEGVVMEWKEKTQGREQGTEEDGGSVRDTHENAS